MATSKTADIKKVRKAGQTALVKFPKGKLVKAFGVMAATANEAEASNESRQAAALDVCEMAHQFAASNADADTGTVVEGWRDNLKLVIMQLAIEGNRFAELIEGKDDKPASAKLTGYGNNVASIAKGCIEFDVAPADTAGDGDGDASYRSVRKLVEGKRAEARRESDPAGAMFADAVASLDETFAELRKLIVDTGDTLNVNTVQGALADMVQDITSQLIAQDDADAAATEAEAEAVAA